MKTNNDHINEIKDILESLNSEYLHRIDFDKLKETLSYLIDELPQLYLSGIELALLKKDYIDRISGMVKAIVVTSKNYNDLESSLDYINSLTGRGAEELIKQYRIVSARFRDAFPASFGLVKQTPGIKSKK